MAENIPDNKPKTVRRPRLKLPFDNRKEDAGDVYKRQGMDLAPLADAGAVVNHRAGTYPAVVADNHVARDAGEGLDRDVVPDFEMCIRDRLSSAHASMATDVSLSISSSISLPGVQVQPTTNPSCRAC